MSLRSARLAHRISRTLCFRQATASFASTPTPSGFIQSIKNDSAGIPFSREGQVICNQGFASKVSAKDAPIDQEHVHIGNEIEKELQKASESGGADAIFKVIETHGEDFDEHNVATAFQELAKEGSNRGNQDVHLDETFLKLVDMAILGRRRFNARLLTSIVKSAAALKFDDEALTDKISENLIQRIDKLDAIEVTDLATGLADLENSPSVVFFEALQKQVSNLDSELNEDQKSQIKEAFKKLGYENYAKKINAK